ncbi:hypothetical protein DC498_24130 [Terrimonas sp.]|uniref:DUF6734 family protein n=1 Tax=Terrimonas sp. TaxID=1914338 RepID=UPI000D509D4D|nr:DUF6734 family protein [Terrimonas sp.]PVD49624.1 hypothetical protein DC498_24130 [Terrimonas sp.]
MRFCQTLWTSDKDLLKDNFGWLSPQHHIMAWALSCLKLKKYYPVVNFYTDKKGVEIFKDHLALPYTNFFDDYSNIDLRADLWALPKLLTYAKQDQPFLHVDGDVFIWQPLKNNLLSSNLIAQNLEKGTGYYSSTLRPLAEQLQYFPSYLKKNLFSHNMKAYNAGILGGADIQFFKKYVAIAEKFLKKNNVANLKGNFNIIFEQLFFFSIAAQENKKVACLFEKTFDDNGYGVEDVASFPTVDKSGYLHLIGHFKRTENICEWVARHLYIEAPMIYLKIVALFREQHFFYHSKIKDVHNLPGRGNRISFQFKKTMNLIKELTPKVTPISKSQLTTYIESSKNLLLKELFKYEQKLSRICSKFNKLNSSDLKEVEIKSVHSIHFASRKIEDKEHFRFKRNPNLEIIYSTFDWTSMNAASEGYVFMRLSKMKDIVIAIVPELFFNGYREVILDQICENIIVLHDEDISYGQLLKKMFALFPPSEEKTGYEAFCKLIELKTTYLIQNKILI